MERRQEGAAMFTLSPAQFKSKLAGAKASGQNMQKGFHVLLMAALAYSDTDRNATPCLQILSALPDAVRKSDVKRWIEAHSNVRITTKKVDGKVLLGVRMVGPDKEEYKAVNFDYANAHPFYEEVKRVDDVALVADNDWFAKQLAALVRKANKARDAGTLTLDQGNEKRLADIESMARAIKAA